MIDKQVPIKKVVYNGEEIPIVSPVSIIVGGKEVSKLTFTSDPQTQLDGVETSLVTMQHTKANKTEVTEEINSAVSAVVGAAPEAFDTLKEIADWIENDETGSAALVNRVESIENKNNIQDTAINTINASLVALQAIVNDKVDKVEGKGLSTNDFTDTEKTKLAGIAENANLVTKTSQLENDSGFITSVPAAPVTSVNAKTGAVVLTGQDINLSSTDTKKLNAAIEEKAAKSTTLAGYGIADAYTKTEVDAKVASVYRFKGSVASYSNLPTTNVVTGDVYNVEDTGANYAWTGASWDKLSETIDLSNYATKQDISDIDNDITNINTNLNKYLSKQGGVIYGDLEIYNNLTTRNLYIPNFLTTVTKENYILTINDYGEVAARATNELLDDIGGSTAIANLQAQITENTNDITTNTQNILSLSNSIPTALSQLTPDATHRTVTDAEKTTWNSKATDTTVIHKTGNETVGGTKNFTGTFQINGGTISYEASTQTFTI